MVEPVNFVSQVLGTSQNNRSSRVEQDEQGVEPSSVDEVALSAEAISLSQAEQSAAEVSAQIANDLDIVLSADAERLNSLV